MKGIKYYYIGILLVLCAYVSMGIFLLALGYFPMIGFIIANALFLSA